MAKETQPQWLDELVQQYPYLEKIVPFVDIVNQESPRGKALIATGFLEEQLKQLLLAFLIKSDTAEEFVEAGNAPLGTLSSLTKPCFLLALISRHERHD